MVKQSDIHGFQRVAHPQRHRPIAFRWQRHAAGVVVGQDNAAGAGIQGILHYLAHADRRSGHAALADAAAGHFLASKTTKDGSTYKNLSFPMHIPGQPDKCVGLEERGYPRKDGSARKGMATSTNASEGLWMASPKKTALQDARIVLVFESAYDAMAFYQLQMRKESGLDQRGRQDLKAGVYVSTGGNPSYGQIQGLLKAAPQATFHLGFDKDVAGKQFVANFEDIASKQSPVAPGNVPADMRDFMESFDKQPKTIKELLSFNDENYSLLPHELKQLFLVYDSAKEEALEYHYSPFLCKEDKQEAADKMNKAFKDFKDALLQKLNLHEDQAF